MLPSICNIETSWRLLCWLSVARNLNLFLLQNFNILSSNACNLLNIQHTRLKYTPNERKWSCEQDAFWTNSIASLDLELWAFERDLGKKWFFAKSAKTHHFQRLISRVLEKLGIFAKRETYFFNPLYHPTKYEKNPWHDQNPTVRAHLDSYMEHVLIANNYFIINFFWA